MNTAPVKTLIDEQVEELETRTRPALVRGTFSPHRGMRVADLPYPIKADWLKRRPIKVWR
ncbi:MAG TPA: hypothetical protein VF682_19200 [Pseudomonas sp.]|jgi:hypothetical protein